MGGMQTDSDDQGRLNDRHEADKERPAGRELISCRGSVRQRSRSDRMRRAGVPQDRLVLETQLVEDPMDDRRRVLDMAAPIEARPALRWERPLGREGHPREPTARVPGCLPDKQQGRARPSSKMIGQGRQPDRRPIRSIESWVGVAIRIERCPDLSSGQIVKQAIESVHYSLLPSAPPEELRGSIAETLPGYGPSRGFSIVSPQLLPNTLCFAWANSSSVREPCSRKRASRASASGPRASDPSRVGGASV